MTWPDITAFDKAVQLAAFPPHGRLSEAVVDKSGGLMRRMEGANAAAYVLKGPAGELVLRCFKDKPTPAIQRRYEALTQRAARTAGDNGRRTSVLADAVWLSEAVKIGGRWWPAVVMEHVAGRSLRAHLESRRDHPDELNRLAAHWLDLLGYLDRHGLAHGDLQHDNIRVPDGAGLRLIDLDAVWMSEISGDPPREFGHPHFQHPERLRAHQWDRNVDRFAALVIQLSILGLAADPGLWDDFHNEDNLLFTAEDFAHPMKTPLWFRLAASRSVHVRRLTVLLDRACGASPAEAPSFRALNDIGTPPEQVPQPPSRPPFVLVTQPPPVPESSRPHHSPPPPKRREPVRPVHATGSRPVLVVGMVTVVLLLVLAVVLGVKP